MLEDFQSTGKIISDYLSEYEKRYLDDNISTCEIIKVKNNWCITSVIVKK
jgi:hypothetical protein